MALLRVLAYPDPRLRTRAAPVEAFDAGLTRLIDDMFDTMYAACAIGLAATQVDVHRQVVTIDVSGCAQAPQVFINPEILSRGRLGLVEESCLSLPGLAGTVKRHTALRVRWRDRAGATSVREVEGMLAVCLGHEVDHLHGALFLDRLPLLRRLRARAQFARRPAPPPAHAGSASRA